MTKTHKHLNKTPLWTKSLAVLALTTLLIPTFAASDQPVMQGGPNATLKTQPTFKFVVIGDTRTGVAVFERCIEEINLLAPDLVLNVGDLIPGYKNSTRQITAMWNEFDQRVKKLQVPLIVIPGNHDIWSRKSREIYQQRYGKTYFSFNHKDVHFVILDSEARDDNGKLLSRIDDKQIEWLKTDLASNRDARLTFVFLHKPFWNDKRFNKDATKNWFKSVHPILAKHSVAAVFAGHYHSYAKCPQVDGVNYYITGGGGAPVGPDPTMGDFHHYCLVTVTQNQWKLALIRPGSIESDEPETVLPLGLQALRSSITVPEIVVPDAPGKIPIKLTFANWKPRTLNITVKPSDISSSHFRTTPNRRSTSVKSKEEVHFKFNTAIDPEHAYPVPKFTFEVRDQGITQRFDYSVPVKAHRTTICNKTSTPPRIDGKLNDPVWKTTTPLATFFDRLGNKQTSFPTQVHSTYDSQNLYLAFRCQEPNLAGLIINVSSHDGPLWEDDSVEIFFDTNLDKKTYYQFIFNPNAIAYDGTGMNPKWNGKHTAKTSRTKDAWTLELAIPFKTIGIESPKPGTKLGLQIARTRAQSPRESTQWSPTYAGNHVPTQFGTIIFK